mgnify:CR=1 FL=1|tara:strand:+ start:144 stop:524 length:381 start_codon:yes stop_codon:yes gene_type:complete
MLIYKLISENTDLIYVGKTIQTLKRRLWEHRSKYKRYIEGTSIKYCSSYKVLEHGDYSIVLIGETEDDSSERFWIKQLDACNERTLDYDELEYQAKRVACRNCGAVVNRGSMLRHKRSQRCQNSSA